MCCEPIHKLYIGSTSPTHDRQPPTDESLSHLTAPIIGTQQSSTHRKQGWQSADPQLPHAFFSAHLFRPYIKGKKFAIYFFFSLSLCNCQANIYSFIINKQKTNPPRRISPDHICSGHRVSSALLLVYVYGRMINIAHNY